MVEAEFKPRARAPTLTLPSPQGEKVRGRLQGMGASLQGGECWAGDMGDPLFLEN